MNYIIEKETRIVKWINKDSRQLKPKEVGNFNPDTHEIVFAPSYLCNIEEEFKAKIINGAVLKFKETKVWKKNNPTDFRIISSWNDLQIQDN
jgi:hypothetical protein